MGSHDIINITICLNAETFIFFFFAVKANPFEDIARQKVETFNTPPPVPRRQSRVSINAIATSQINNFEPVIRGPD